MGRSAGGGVGGVPILLPVGPSCAWRGAAVVSAVPTSWVSPSCAWRGVAGSGSVCQFRVCSCVLGRCTRSVGNAPFLIGCSAPYRVQRHVTGTVPPCLWRLPGMWASSDLELSSAWGTSWGLCGASCCGSSEMLHVIPRHVFQTLKSHRWNSAVFPIPMKS